jgi:hypothetical protein
MRRLYLILVSSLIIQSVNSQKYLGDFIDSALEISHFSDNDWAITYTKQQSGNIPLIDSLGNLIPELDWRTTIVFSNIQNQLYIQKFKDTCFFNEKCFYAGKRHLLPKNIKLNFTSDSINQVDKEYIYPYIHKNDSLNTYDYQEPSTHSAYFRLTFLTKKINKVSMFPDNSFDEKLWFYLDSLKNINFDYNSKTFIYRIFKTLEKLFKEHKELITLE